MAIRQDLRKRTNEFAGGVIMLYRSLPLRRMEVEVVGRQDLRSPTSVAAHYREASRARSRADILAKIGGCLQEADETQLWLELFRDDCEVKVPAIEALWNEANELISMFVAMSRNTKAAGL